MVGAIVGKGQAVCFDELTCIWDCLNSALKTRAKHTKRGLSAQFPEEDNPSHIRHLHFE